MSIRLLINIDVEDLERAVSFYCSALGFQVGRRWGKAVAELLGGTSPVYLLAKKAGSVASASAPVGRHYHRHWTPVHLDVVVDDVEAAVGRAIAAGAVLEGGIEQQAWGRLAVFSDPFGNGFCLLQFLGRGYDELPA